eukprot:2065319-Amphidinium_carterae.1
MVMITPINASPPQSYVSKERNCVTLELLTLSVVGCTRLPHHALSLCVCRNMGLARVCLRNRLRSLQDVAREAEACSRWRSRVGHTRAAEGARESAADTEFLGVARQKSDGIKSEAARQVFKVLPGSLGTIGKAMTVRFPDSYQPLRE